MIIGNDRKDEALTWARSRMGLEGPCGPCLTFSRVDKDNNFCAVFVFSDLNEYSACIHYAGRPGGHGFAPDFVAAAFDYAFITLGLSRLTGPTRGSNQLALRIAPKFGFTHEGVMRKAFVDGDDCHIFGFLREDYLNHKWRKGKSL